MKSIFQLLLLIAAVSLTMTALASEKSRSGHGNGYGNGPQKYPFYELGISGHGGSTGSEYLSVNQRCIAYPNDTGGVVVFGEIQISGFFLGESVQVYESYDGLDACPENSNVLSKDSSQTVTIRFGELVVSANCTGQIMQRGSDKTELEQPGGKIRKTDLMSWKRSTTDGSEGICEMTASDSDGNTEMFGLAANTDIYIGYISQY